MVKKKPLGCFWAKQTLEKILREHCTVFHDVAAHNSSWSQVSACLLKEISKHLRRAGSKCCGKRWRFSGEVVDALQTAPSSVEIFVHFFCSSLWRKLCMLHYCSVGKLSCNLEAYILVLFHFRPFSCKSSTVKQSCLFSWFKICWLPFKANNHNGSITLPGYASPQRKNTLIQLSAIFRKARTLFFE